VGFTVRFHLIKLLCHRTKRGDEAYATAHSKDSTLLGGDWAGPEDGEGFEDMDPVTCRG
jgi:hypothetical protein